MRLAIVLSVVLLGIPCAAWAQGSRWAKDADLLRGIGEMSVVIEEMPELKTLLPRETIQTDVELRLRQNGIKVTDAAKSAIALPYLWIQPNVLVGDDGFVVYSLVVVFQQIVLVPVQEAGSTEAKPKVAIAGVWQKSLVGAATLESTGRIRDAIRDLVDKFLNDYLAANPKK